MKARCFFSPKPAEKIGAFGRSTSTHLPQGKAGIVLPEKGLALAQGKPAVFFSFPTQSPKRLTTDPGAGLSFGVPTICRNLSPDNADFPQGDTLSGVKR